MPTAPSKVFVHVGLHKTGTTYLQSMLAANREALRAGGLYYPGGAGEPAQTFARMDLFKVQPRGYNDPRVPGAWQRLVDGVNSCGTPSALISDEALSRATVKQIRQIVDAFPNAEVHAVITLRDLGRVVVSDWQELVKNDKTWTWPYFVAEVKDSNRVAANPARGFWSRHDAIHVTDGWSDVVPTDRVHLVTVPRSGASPDELLRRFASVVGFDPAALTEEPAWSNETLGAAETEVLRRVNERLGGRLNQRAYDHAVKTTLVQLLASRPQRSRFTLPEEEVAWFAARADEMIHRLKEGGFPVAGDLDELRVTFTPSGRRPDEVAETELEDTALDALALLTEKYASTWWARKKTRIEERHSTGGVTRKARNAVSNGQRRVARLAERNRAVEKALAAALRIRDRGRERVTRE